MAQQQAPPAAQAPIVVAVDEVQITSDAMLVLVPGAQHVKDHTPCLSWTTVYDNAGAVINYTLGQSDAKGAFMPRCRFSVDQQTGTLLDGNHVLNVLFNGAFWSRLLTALDAANLFATSMEKIGVLHQRDVDHARLHGREKESFCKDCPRAALDPTSAPGASRPERGSHRLCRRPTWRSRSPRASPARSRWRSRCARRG